MTRRHLILVGLLPALLVPAGLVAQKELVLRHGEQVFLRLAPVDPRSLIEGDYMRLSYAITNEVFDAERPSALGGGTSHPPPPRADDGHLVLALDDRRVARFLRVDDGSPLSPGEVRIRYRRRHGRVRIGTDAFYFQEGHAERYEAATYGEVRLTRSGDAVLVGLRDQDLVALGGAPSPAP